MEGPGRTGEQPLKEVILSSVRSTGFWSFIAAVVGVVAVTAGGILFLTIEEMRNFSVSVLIIGISLLFLALVLSPRAVAMFLIGRQGKYGANEVIMAVAFLAIAVLVNFMFFRNSNRFDITATRALSLSLQTAQVLDSLRTEVRANAFFVEGDTRTASDRNQAEDLLNEFARHTNRFSYRFVDPELRRSVALQHEVTDYPVIVFEDMDAEEGRRQSVFSFTEQDFVTGILVATGVRQKSVYFLTGHKEATVTRDVTGQADDEGLDFALQRMQRDNYTVLPLNLKQTGSVPENAAVLIIAGPKQDLDAQEKTALMEYLKSGGRLVAMFDPNTPDSFVDLLHTWGVTLGRKSIADAVSNLYGETLTPLLQRTNGQYTSGDITGIGIADQIDGTFFPGATSVDLLIPREALTPRIGFTPLALTTPASWLETDLENVDFDPDVDRPGPFSVAAVIQATQTADETDLHPLVRLVVFGDSDFAKNKFFYSNDNADFLLNSVNWLAEDFELISIRPKLIAFRDLVVNTRERDFIRWSSWFLPPAVMVLLSIVVWWRRR